MGCMCTAAHIEVSCNQTILCILFGSCKERKQHGDEQTPLETKICIYVYLNILTCSLTSLGIPQR